MIYHFNIPGRKYKLPRKQKKKYIANYGVKQYTFLRLKQQLEKGIDAKEKKYKDEFLKCISENLPNFEVQQENVGNGTVLTINAKKE